MNLKSLLGWFLVLLILSPFIAYGAGQFIPFYDGFVVTSGSMEPEIQTGAILFTYKVPAEQIQVGDTITFQEGESFTTHKVIERNREPVTFRTKGTANSSPDPGPVTADEVVGKKLFSIPYTGYFISWAGTQTGIALLIVVPGTILILMEVRKILIEARSTP